MKKLFLFLLLVSSALITGAVESDGTIVCDEETGVCKIVSVDNGKNDTAAKSQIVCDEETGICTIIPGEDEPTGEEAADTGTIQKEEFIPVRRHIGYTGKDEFMAFLQNGESAGTNKTFWGMVLLALLGGLALNLTPCVLPMLPVNLAIIGAAGGGLQGFRRGLLYGCGMAAAYGILGVLAAFAGVSFGALNSSPLFNFAIGTVFVVLSLAMAGVFHIDPASKFHVNVAKFNFSKDLTALVMGSISALLAGACIAPVVISVLLFASQCGWYGCFIPFALGIGMALPWPLAGAGLAILPKPGRFMVVLKNIFAILIFAAAVYYIHLGIKLLPSDNMERNLDGFAALEAAKIESRQTGKPVLVKFTASWCKNCHAMEKNVLQDPEVKKYMDENYVTVTFPAEDPTRPDIAALLAGYEVPGFPAFVILK